jgi:hypothetical protein
MKKELIKLANHLDNIGHRDLADRLDSVIKKNAQSDLGTEFDPSDTVEAAGNSVDMIDSTVGAVGSISDSLSSTLSAAEILEREAEAEGETEVEETTEAEVEALSDDFVLASNFTQDRIEKMSNFLSGIFSSGEIPSVRR